jgi:hypothetical protein
MLTSPTPMSRAPMNGIMWTRNCSASNRTKFATGSATVGLDE